MTASYNPLTYTLVSSGNGALANRYADPPGPLDLLRNIGSGAPSGNDTG